MFVAHMIGSVGSLLSSTPPAAEHCAVLAAGPKPRAEMCVDYQGAIDVHLKKQVSPFRLMGPSRSLEGSTAAPLGPRLHKIEARVDIESLAQGSDEWRRAKGNEAADKYAKFAAAKGPRPSTHEIEHQTAQKKMPQKFFALFQRPSSSGRQ